jgi:hypothetical protein
MEMIALGMDTVKRSPTKKNPQSAQISRKGSIGGSFVDGSSITNETDEHKTERELK